MAKHTIRISSTATLSRSGKTARVRTSVTNGTVPAQRPKRSG